MARKHVNIKLSDQEEKKLMKLIRKGEHSSRILTRAQILLRNHEGYAPKQIKQMVYCSEATVFNILNRYKKEGIQGALIEKPRSCEHRKKINQKIEGEITMIACSDPPSGKSNWTLRLIRDKYIEISNEATLSHETVRKVLKKVNSSLG